MSIVTSKRTKRSTESEQPISKRKKTTTEVVSKGTTTSNSKPSMAVMNLIKTVRSKYTAAKNDEYAKYISKYMRNKFEFLGLRSPVRRAINKEKEMPKVKKAKRSDPVSEQSNLKRKKTTTDLISKETITNSKPSMAVVNLIKTVKTRYTAAKNDKYAAFATKYMRNQFKFLGLRYPERRAINKEIFASHEVLSHPDMYDMFYLLWEETIREYQCFVLDYLDMYMKHINQPKWNDQNFTVLKHLITHKSWWDTVDELAYKHVGRIVASDKKKYNKLMDEWIEDDNMWLRRTAILHQLMYKEKTDTDRLFSYSLKCAHEKEFFIQKSIGWALRNHYRTDPKIIKDFVKKNEDKLATLSKKEALKHA